MIVKTNSSIIVKDEDGADIKLTLLKTPIDLEALGFEREIIKETIMPKKLNKIKKKAKTVKVIDKNIVEETEEVKKLNDDAKMLNMIVLKEPIPLDDILFDNADFETKEITFNVKTIQRNFACNPPRRRVNAIQYQKWKQYAYILFECTFVYPFIYSSNTFKCFICSAKFLDVHLLKNHTLNEHNILELKNELDNCCREKNLKVDIACLNCRLCQYEAMHLKQLKVHLKEAHFKDIDPEFQDNIVPFKLGGETFECQFCSESFLKLRLLIIHMSKHFNNFSCEICGSVYISLNLLKRHLQTHENGNFPCDQCDKTFSNPAKRNVHIRGVHLKVCPRRCPICPERFNSNYQRTKHLRVVHNQNLRLFKCQTCGREYDMKCHLSLHIRSVHLQERNFECTVCASRFFSKELLNRHVAIHTGEKKFRCEICNKAYVRKKNLKEHLRVHESFPCTICGLGFYDEVSLVGHVTANHSIGLI